MVINAGMLQVQSFTSYLIEATLRQQQIEFKAYIRRSFPQIKFTQSSRGAFHVRFPVAGDEAEHRKLLKKYGIEVREYSPTPISDKYPTVLLVATKQLSPKLPRGSSIPWVNNAPSASVKGAQLFSNKALSPDNLGIAGKTLTIPNIIQTVGGQLRRKYDPATAKQLNDMMWRAAGAGNDIRNENNFSVKDLAKVSADFGEILSAIWTISNLRFKEAHFPKASNERLIDFYAIRFGIKYPISVKSGGGGKVTIQNIIDAIQNRAKSADRSDMASEPSLAIFNIVNKYPMKEQMFELHKYMDTEPVRLLAGIMGVRVPNINLDTVLNFTDNTPREDLIRKLEPFWRSMNTVLTDRIKNDENDALRLVLSPLGENIWKVLNADKEIQDSLTRVARQVTLIQVNVNVSKTAIKIKHNYFKDAEFQFGWAGYAAKNKLGFKMKVTN